MRSRELKPISDRARKILTMIALGMNQQEMADILGSTKFVIHRQCTRLYMRLEASNAPSAVAIAIAKGVIPNPYDESGHPVGLANLLRVA